MKRSVNPAASSRPGSTQHDTDSIFYMPQQWSPSTWKDHPIKQQPAWPDEAAYDRALKNIASMPPLVFAGEARSLQANLAKVAAGNAFLLQAGDCAESFEEFSADNIREKLRII